MRWMLPVLAACSGAGKDEDADADGWPSSLDCDDGDSAVFPSAAETCNGLDDDCDGLVDAGALDALPWFADADADGAGSASSFVLACEAPEGSVAEANDCDDGDAAVHPLALETCNGRDDDCDGSVDEQTDGVVPHFPDADGDGHGDLAAPDLACVMPAGHVPLGDDCDDTQPSVFPGADERCNTLDDDCDEEVDEDATDALLWHPDLDGDGYGSGAVEMAACAAPPDWLADGTDCDDYDGTSFPGADERCDGEDNDCDAVVDGESAIDPLTWYRDLDEDGVGSQATVQGCDAPAGYVSVPGDCNDSDAGTSPLSPEVCANANDDDCNGLVDECGEGSPASTFVADELAVATWTSSTAARLWWLAPGGDLDGDGREELVFAAPEADVTSRDMGLVYVAYGSDTPGGDTLTETLPRFAGARQDDRLAYYGSLGAAGDLDGDGLGDLLVGATETDAASGTSDVGVVSLLYGSATRESGGTSISTFDAFFSATTQLRVGHGTTGVGDMDGDGLDDAAFAAAPSTGEGTVYLLYGDTTRASGTTQVSSLPRVTGESGDNLGAERGLAGADLDGDGLVDLVLGAPSTPDGTQHLHVLYGDPVRPTVLGAGTLPELADGTGEVAYSFGRTLRPIGDPNGDGYEDVAASDVQYVTLGASYMGQSWLLGGSATRWTGTTDLADASFATILGVSNNGSCGWEARSLGDWSGDAVDDLALSTPYWPQPYADAGGVGIFYGPLSGDLRFDEADQLLQGSSGSMDLGYGLVTADVDGDGLRDLAMLANGAENGAGRVFLVLGGTL
jgi:hypothetical protein